MLACRALATHRRAPVLGLCSPLARRPCALRRRCRSLVARSGAQKQGEEPLALTEATASQPPGAVLSQKQEGPSSDLSIILERLQTVGERVLWVGDSVWCSCTRCMCGWRERVGVDSACAGGGWARPASRRLGCGVGKSDQD